MARIRAIVFDVGGTLIYPVDPVGETYARFAHHYGIKLPIVATTAAFHQAMKHSPLRAEGAIPNNGDDRIWWKDIVKRSLPEQLFADAAAFESFFEEIYLYYAKPEAWGIYPEVFEVLEAIRDRPIELVALTNWDARLHSVLDGNGLGEFLPRRFISAELGWEKPDPAIYRHVADVLNVPPHSLLSVGDDPRKDIEGPRKAGWQTVQIERPKRDLWDVVRIISR
jgi:putative hydrolase of the HAD superfamily